MDPPFGCDPVYNTVTNNFHKVTHFLPISCAILSFRRISRPCHSESEGITTCQTLDPRSSPVPPRVSAGGASPRPMLHETNPILPQLSPLRPSRQTNPIPPWSGLSGCYAGFLAGVLPPQSRPYRRRSLLAVPRLVPCSTKRTQSQSPAPSPRTKRTQIALR